ncbi:G patch domain-containing protein 11 isoform X2 [Exaiptasia diaphana]|uniref:G patch domain-containing protein 11 n=1 Tax=Exaiptasia diaphana TaxID=2652724 RepID=A0A913YS93_EXADI|nr:G patch domain-containing protein 11 isoform X2 [Exaiptasia diaphana]
MKTSHSLGRQAVLDDMKTFQRSEKVERKYPLWVRDTNLVSDMEKTNRNPGWKFAVRIVYKHNHHVKQSAIMLLLDRLARKGKVEAKHEQDKERNKVKPMKQREQENREEGMAKALDSSNIGFALLQKMGYKQGTGLGKEGTGRAEPIPISLKADRGGLGRDNHLKRQNDIKKTILEEKTKKKIKVEQRLREDFRKHMSNKFVDKKVQSDLYKSQKACEQLDKAKGLSCIQIWFWPEVPKEEEEEEEDNNTGDVDCITLEPYDKLIQLTQYLRSEHLYCIWCGTTYNDDTDLSSNCPGDTAEDHD